jgi:two-component system chemotaxis sensor kinase CheA
MAGETGGGGSRDALGEKAREEFFSEAQELVDGLSRDLLALDEITKRGDLTDPELINDVFRAVHTLKGLSGLFGAAIMSGLSHELENLLDDLRLGRIELTPPVLDLLFQAVELYGRILASVKGDSPEPHEEVKALLVALGQVTQARAGGGVSLVAQYELDPGLLGVLTEYEEHRLRTNIQAGLLLYRIRVQFSLATIDSALDDLKAKARPHGEIITYLPTGAGGDMDSIELEILVASKADLPTLRQAITGPNVSIEEIPRRDPSQLRTSLPVPPYKAEPEVRFKPDEALTDRTAVIPAHGPVRPRDEAAAEPEDDEAERARTPVPDGSGSVPPVAVPGGGGGAGGGGGGRELSLRSISQTVRVDIRKLDHLMTIVGELAIVRSAILRASEKVRGRPELRELGIELHRLHRTFDRHLSQMQNGILEVRMVPLGQIFDKLARIVRQISREHDKQVNLVITGAETEIDKLIVEELSDPLMHMIRNAIDHGIEVRDERLKVGKPPVGTIALNAFQKGNHVLIEVEDDGAGMDPENLVASAVRKGLVGVEESRELTPREILALVFLPGFTTKHEATNLSGRGVGMDIVKTNIAKLGGIVDITSEVGIGTKMTITLPITLAIISVLVVEIGGRSFCMPLATVEEAIVLDEALVRTFEGREVMTQRGATLPICRLGRFFGIDEGVPPGTRTGRHKKSFVVIASVGNRRLGFVVDKLVGQQDIVIKALGKSLKMVRGFAGATELGDQRVGLVLDAGSLIEEVLAGSEARFLMQQSAGLGRVVS